YPYKRVTNQQFGVRMRNRSEQGQAAPEDRSQNDNQFSRIAIRQRPHKRRRNHVEAKKGASQISNLLFGEMKLILHQRLYRKQHIAVRVIEQIERRQNDQRRPRLHIALGHWSREYSMQQAALCRDSWTTVHKRLRSALFSVASVMNLISQVEAIAPQSSSRCPREAEILPAPPPTR